MNNPLVHIKRIVSVTLPHCTYSRMKKKIDILEKRENDVDYADEVFRTWPWTFGYLNDLYEKSVNGSRSQRSIMHIKTVAKSLYACFYLIIVIIAGFLCVFVLKKM